MPTYEYECRECRGRVEAFQKITDDPLTTCAECGGSLRRVLFPVGIVFKGSGFYVTDYKNKENGANGKRASSEKSEDSTGTDHKTPSDKSATESKSTTSGSSAS
jgi:putative FmdB family regulatory protein